MIYTHSVGRALQYFPQHTALLREGHAVTFLELDVKVRRICDREPACQQKNSSITAKHGSPHTKSPAILSS